MTDESKPVDNVIPFTSQEPVEEADTRYSAFGEEMLESLRYQYQKDGKLDRKGMVPPKMTLDQMMQSLVQVTDKKGIHVAFRDAPFIHLPQEAMAAKLRGNVTKVEATKPGQKDQWKPTFGVWQERRNRIQVDGITFNPNEGEFAQDPRGRYCLNLWRPISHVAPAGWTEEWCKDFLGHVRYLIPNDLERDFFLDWLAHIEQRPGELPHHYFLLISKEHGTGRGWLNELLGLVWPGYVAHDFSIQKYLDGRYTGQLSQKLLACVGEVRIGGAAQLRRHMEEMKDLVTTPERFIKEKYGTERYEYNYCRFLLESNHESAIPIDDRDRRCTVIRSPSKPRSEAYYTKLYSLIRNPEYRGLFVSSVREYLRTRPLGGYNPGARALFNEAKRAVIQMSLSEEDERAREVKESWPADLILSSKLYEYVFGMPYDTDDKVAASNAGKLKRIAEDADLTKHPVSHWSGRTRYSFWIIRNFETWRQISDARALWAEATRESLPPPAAT